MEMHHHYGNEECCSDDDADGPSDEVGIRYALVEIRVPRVNSHDYQSHRDSDDNDSGDRHSNKDLGAAPLGSRFESNQDHPGDECCGDIETDSLNDDVPSRDRGDPGTDENDRGDQHSNKDRGAAAPER